MSGRHRSRPRDDRRGTADDIRATLAPLRVDLQLMSVWYAGEMFRIAR